MAAAFGLAEAAAPSRTSAIDARLAGGAVVAAATLTATMYTFHIALHTVPKKQNEKGKKRRRPVSIEKDTT